MDPVDAAPSQPRPDTLDRIGVLKRREIEARIVAPILARFGDEFGHDRVRELAAEVIADVSRDHGAMMAQLLGTKDLSSFGDSMEAWTRGGALEIDVVEQGPTTFAFNVTRCRYAEMYRELDLAELGALMSCNRDATLIEGFNPAIRLTRTQTIMSGDSHCDFRYELPESESPVEL